MIKKTLIVAAFGIFLIALYTNINALPGGIVNLTKRAGNTEGCTCHGLDPTTSVLVTIKGQDTLHYGDTATYTITISGGPLKRAGIDISAGSGLVILSPSDTTLQRLLASAGVYELTHKRPKKSYSDSVSFTFKYIAPITGDRDTLFATGNSVDGSGTPTGDNWNFGQSKVIYLTNVQGISENNGTINNFKLSQNFPNPFNPSTKVNFQINKSGIVKLNVYDIKGNLVQSLINERKNTGEYTYEFNGNGLSSGVYFYKLEVNGMSDAKRMLLIK
jgi:Secretion system C-terminal sorting domain